MRSFFTNRARGRRLAPQTLDMLVVFAVALALRGSLLSLGLYQQGAEAFLRIPGDSRDYVNAAIALLSGEGSYERAFFAFGPGYPVALAFQMKIFGVSAAPLLVVNLLLSSLACVFIYRITTLLGLGRSVAFFGGLAAALSVTSITLSCILLSDTTYLFLLAATLALFLRGLKENQRSRMIGAGALLSFAILTRSIGQLMPLALLALFLLSGLNENLKSSEARRYYLDRWVSVALCLSLPVITMGAWIARNNEVNSHPTLSFTAVGAPARVAAMTLERLTGKPERAIRSERVGEYQRETGKDALEFSDIYSAYERLARETWRERPWEMIRTYVIVDWENWNGITYLHRGIIPGFKDITLRIEKAIKKKGVNYLPVIIAFFGFLLLVKQGRYRTALSIAVLYFYYALLIGFYRYQGSRYFLPAQVVEAALFGVVATALWSKISPRLTGIGGKQVTGKNA